MSLGSLAGRGAAVGSLVPVGSTPPLAHANGIAITDRARHSRQLTAIQSAAPVRRCTMRFTELAAEPYIPQEPARHRRAAVQSNEVYPTPSASVRLINLGGASDKRFPLWKALHNGHNRTLAEGRSRASQLLSWARLLKRVFDLDLEHCPNCGGELKIIAAILEHRSSRRSSRTWVCRPAHRRAHQPVGQALQAA